MSQKFIVICIKLIRSIDQQHITTHVPFSSKWNYISVCEPCALNIKIEQTLITVEPFAPDGKSRPDKARQRDVAATRFAEIAKCLGLPDRWDKSAEGRPIFVALPRVGISVSHSDHWIAIALCLDGPIGIDIEWHRPGRDVAALSHALGWPETGFYRRWCLMEAAYKAGVASMPELQCLVTKVPLQLNTCAVLCDGWHYLVTHSIADCTLAVVMASPNVLCRLADRLT